MVGLLGRCLSSSCFRASGPASSGVRKSTMGMNADDAMAVDVMGPIFLLIYFSMAA